MPALADFPTLHYFMQAYWNQMGDLVHGTFAGAVAEFSARETPDFRRRLFDDLKGADAAGVIPTEIDWSDGRLAGFWADRILTRADLAVALATLAGAETRQ